MENIRDEILDFIEDHRVLCIVAIVVVIIVIAMFGIRSSNLKKKEAERIAQEQQQAIAEQMITLEQDVEEEVVPVNPYKESLGLDANKDNDGRVEVKEEEKEEVVVIPVQSTPTYDTVVNIYDWRAVPERNQDGSSCKKYYNSVTLSDFGTYWGTSLTEDDFFGGERYFVGTEFNPNEIIDEKDINSLESTGWLIDNLDSFEENDVVKFTKLNVIGSLSQSHVALLCSYDWYSAFGMQDTLVVFEDISNTLKVSDFKDGDIFSASIFVHNIKVEPDVKGQRVICVQYTTFDASAEEDVEITTEATTEVESE